MTNQPIASVEQPLLRALFNYLCPQMTTMPDRRAISQEIANIAGSVREKVRSACQCG
jgi:hypothetical protein